MTTNTSEHPENAENPAGLSPETAPETESAPLESAPLFPNLDGTETTIPEKAPPSLAKRLKTAKTSGSKTGVLLHPTSHKTLDKEKFLNVGYEVEDFVGKGSMGEIYRAIQRAVERRVAIKVLKNKYRHDEHVKALFLREAIVTANLDHPNIMTVYDLRETDDRALFYAMRDVRGACWMRVLKDKSLEENLEILMKVCDAIAFAHSKGIIHRDVKPDNVMLGEFGEVVVMDWGTAANSADMVGKLTEDQIEARFLSFDSDLEGTPEYMSPEMAFGDPTKIGFLSDIYLLGGILYEIVTGLKPHYGDNIYECVYAAARNVIQPTELKGELINIAMKAMSLDPKDRYQSVKDFQNALRAYRLYAESYNLAEMARRDLEKARKTQDYQDFAQARLGFREAITLWKENELAKMGLSYACFNYANSAFKKGDYDLAVSLLDPTNSMHEFLLEKIAEARKKEKRKTRDMKAMTVFSGAMVLLIIGALLVAFFRAQDQRQALLGKLTLALADRDRARKELSEKDLDLYRYQIQDAKHELEDARPERALEILDQTSPGSRSWEWAMLRRLAVPEERAMVEKGLVPLAAAFAPDNAYIAAGFSDRSVRVWSQKTGHKLFQLNPLPAPPRALAVGPDGKSLLVAAGNIAYLYALGAMEPSSSLNVADPIEDIAFSANGKLILIAEKTSASVWDVAQTKVLFSFPGGDKALTVARFTPDSSAVLLLFADGRSQFWDTAQGAPRKTLRDCPVGVSGADFSSDGDYLVLTAGSRIRLYRAADWALIREIASERPIGKTRFLPHSHRFATISADGREAYLWSMRVGPPLKVFGGFAGVLRDISPSADGRRMVSVGPADRLTVWDTDNTLYGGLVRAPGELLFNPLIAVPGNPHIKLSCRDGDVRVVDARDYRPILRLNTDKDPALAASFSPDGKRVIALTRKQTVKIWDAASGEELLTLIPRLETAAKALGFSAENNALALELDNSSAIAWEGLRPAPTTTH